jgi:hypothetical protein
MRRVWRLPKLKGRDTDSDQSTSQQEQESKENEKLQAVFIRQSGTSEHNSDCAVNRAPAETPGPCDCDKGIDAAVKAFNDIDPHHRKHTTSGYDSYGFDILGLHVYVPFKKETDAVTRKKVLLQAMIIEAKKELYEMGETNVYCHGV